MLTRSLPLRRAKAPCPAAKPVLFLISMILCPFPACAKVADPLPPIVNIPPPLSHTRVMQVGGKQTQLAFSVPAADVREVEIFRECNDTAVADTLPEGADPYARLRIEELAVLGSKERVFIDPESKPNQVCGYWVRTINLRGSRSRLTLVARSVPLPVPGPPRRIWHEVKENQIVLRWEAPLENLDGSSPPDVRGYLINSEHLVDRTEFVDTEFEFDREAHYQIQSVGHREDPMVLSNPAPVYSLVPRDTFAPAAPKNPAAVAVGGKIQLVWEENEERDLQGYYIYRGPEKDRLKRFSPLLPLNRFIDGSVQAGTAYFYGVSAVDRSGNESPLSIIVSAAIN